MYNIHSVEGIACPPDALTVTLNVAERAASARPKRRRAGANFMVSNGVDKRRPFQQTTFYRFSGSSFSSRAVCLMTYSLLKS